MSFDALTISGLLAAILSGGFLFGVVTHNDQAGPTANKGRTGATDYERQP